MFHVGQMVECVDGSPTEWPGWITPHVVQGAVYTIREVCLTPAGRYGVILFETKGRFNDHPNVMHEQGWRQDRFRPLQDRKLEVFRALLVDLPALPKFEPTKEGV